MALSNKIRKHRFDSGEMTQKQLAERVGVSRQTMNAIENGRYAPTVEVAIRIADVFGITVDKLFDLEYEGRPVRRHRPETIAVERSQTAVQKTVRLDEHGDPAKEGEGRKPPFAHLARIIDS